LAVSSDIPWLCRHDSANHFVCQKTLYANLTKQTISTNKKTS